MHIYSERIKRAEGSQLFRIRWYGSKPHENQNVFLELKTHHESWISNSSVKERVCIMEEDVSKLLDLNHERLVIMIDSLHGLCNSMHTS